MSTTPDDTSLVPRHKFPIGGSSLFSFLILLFLLVPQDALALRVGDRVVVQNTGNDGLRIRSGAGTGYAEIGKVYDGDKGTIVSGPRGNVYTWWRVNWDSSSKRTGWSAEADSDGSPVWLARDASAVKPSISSVGNASATEGNTLSFTVRLSASTSQRETYYYSTYYGGSATAERGDYDGEAEESIRVSSGRSSFTVRISTNEDTDFDDETFYLYVTGEANHPNTTPGSSQYRGTGTIRDDDEPVTKPSISSVGDASATEGNTLSFTVRLSASTSQTETYYYSTFYGGGATAERGDYDGEAEESIRVSSGRSSFTVRISTNEDADFDDETLYLYVTGEANHPNITPGSSRNRGTGTIRDDDEPVTKPSISSVGDASAAEGNTLSFTVRLSASTSQTETYYYSTFYGGGATAERGDYDGEAEESIRVSSGRNSFTVRISTNEDTDFDDETFYLYVTGEANHPNTTPGSSQYRGTGTIRDDDEPVTKPSISSVSDASATEGNTLSFTVRLSTSTSQTETYYYSTYYGGGATAERGDYDGEAEESIRVSSGQSSFTIRISSNEDADFDDETFYLYVTGEANHPNTTPGSSNNRGTGTIRDDDEPVSKPSISSVGDASATEGNTLSFTVRLSASTSQTETYYYSTFYGGGATAERGDYDGEAEESIRVSSGRNSFTVRISTNEDTDFDDETFYLYVTGEANHPNTTPGSSQYRGTGTIRDDDEPVTKPSISSVSDASATEGNTLSFTVRLSASTSQTETYYYSTYYGGSATAERGDYDGAAEESIRVSSGRSSFTIRISTNEDADFDDETFYLYVTGEANHPNTTPGSSNNRGTGTIRDDDSTTPTSQISIGDAEATEGNAITFTVTLTPAPTSSLTYWYATYQGSARGGGQDYQGKFATALPFNSGETRKTIQISTIEDTAVESEEQFYIYITDASSKHPASGTPTDYLARATGTIRDNDSSATPGTPTPPDPSAPSGTHKYTFSLDNKTYTVVSENCYSDSDSRNAIERYAASLRIYNNRNELIRPTSDILFQLTAAHASACLIDGIRFSNIDKAINLAQERNNKLREEITKGKTTSQITAGIAAIVTVIAVAAAIVSTGGVAAPLVFGLLGLTGTGLGLFVVVEKKEDLAIVVADLFLTSKRGLEQAKEYSKAIENYDLTGTINVNDLNIKMDALDMIIDNITFAQQWLSDGRDLSIALYPTLEGSTWEKGLDTIFIYERTISNSSINLSSLVFRKISGVSTIISGIEDLAEAINIKNVASKLNEHLKDVLDRNMADVKSPFKTLVKYRSNIYGYALTGTRNTDIIRNFESGAKLSGGSGNDWIYSEHVVTVMYGEGGNDYLFGGSKEDILIGGSGNDELRGGGGQDIAGFSGNRANYDIRWDNTREWITISSSADGSDRVYRDIESLYFRDGTLATSDIEAPSRNLAPILAGNIEKQTAFAGERFEYYIPANIFVDPDGDTLTWRVSGLPGWLSFNSNTRLLSGTPTANDLGRKWVTVSVTGSADSVTFTLLIHKRNSPPVVEVSNASYTVDVDGGWTSLSGLSVTDADNDELIVVMGVKYGQLRATGTIVKNMDVSSDDLLADAVGFHRSSPSRINAALATLEYRPANDWESGRDVLILLVGDSKVETPVLGVISIDSETKPVFSGTVSDQTYTAGTAISTLTLPAATGGQAPLTYSLTPIVPGLTFTASTRTLSGTPTTAGTHTMTYKVTDAHSNTDTETFMITVEGTGNAADFNGDGRVDINDYLLFFAHYGLSQGDAEYDARYDLDGNGTIGVMDFLIFSNSYGQTS